MSQLMARRVESACGTGTLQAGRLANRFCLPASRRFDGAVHSRSSPGPCRRASAFSAPSCAVVKTWPRRRQNNCKVSKYSRPRFRIGQGAFSKLFRLPHAMEQKIHRDLLEWERNYIIPLAFIAGEATPDPLLWSRETASLFRTWGHFREPGTTSASAPWRISS